MIERQTPNGPGDHHAGDTSRGRRRWMMIACCIPMLLIAVVLVATGVIGVGFLVIAVACTVLMALMMGAGGHPGHEQG